MDQSRWRVTAPGSATSQKLGHPVPDSYFWSELKSRASQPAQW
jgi:hypothetical protein